MRQRLVLLVMAVLATACNGGTSSSPPSAVTLADSTSAPTSTSTTADSTASSASSPSSTSTATVPTDPDDTVATSTTTDDSDSDTEEPPDVVIDDMEALLVPVRQDAADRTGAETDEVRVVDMEIREWPDSSLGCPQEGESYTDAPTAGIRLVVEAAGSTLDYRLNFEGSFWLCE